MIYYGQVRNSHPSLADVIVFAVALVLVGAALLVRRAVRG